MQDELKTWHDAIYGSRHLIKAIIRQSHAARQAMQNTPHVSSINCTYGIGHPEFGTDCTLTMPRREDRYLINYVIRRAESTVDALRTLFSL